MACPSCQGASVCLLSAVCVLYVAAIDAEIAPCAFLSTCGPLQNEHATFELLACSQTSVLVYRLLLGDSELNSAWLQIVERVEIQRTLQGPKADGPGRKSKGKAGRTGR